MKVTFFTHYFYPSIGGVQRETTAIASFLARRGHSLSIVTRTQARKRDTFPFKVLRGPNTANVLRAVWASQVVVSNGLDPLGFLAAKAFRKPLLWHHYDLDLVCPKATAYNPRFGEEFCMRPSAMKVRRCYGCLRQDRPARLSVGMILTFWLRRTAWRLVNVHVTNSMFMAESMGLAESGLPTSVVPLPIPDDYFIPPLEERGDFLLFVGRLIPEKGLDVLLDALGICRRRGTVIPLRVCGSGGDMDRLRLRAARLGVDSQVEFLGFVTDETLKDLYGRCLALVVPALWLEPSTFTIVEAQSRGALVIASDAGGNRELVGAGGMLFRPGSPEDLASKLTEVSRDPAKVLTFGKIALLQAERNRMEHVGSEYEALIEGLFPVADNSQPADMPSEGVQ